MIRKLYISALYIMIALFACFAGSSARAGYQNVSLETAAPASSIPADDMSLKYDVYAGGFKALDAQLDMKLAPKAYDIELSAQTQGFIGKLFPWSADYTTSGHTSIKGGPVPSEHLTRSTWRDDVKTVEMEYGPKGQLLKTTKQENDKTTVNRDVKKSLSADAVDMLTGTLMMLRNTGETDKCAGSFPVFDGKHRYNITLQDAGTEVLAKSKYSSFSGTALRCTLEVKPVAGFKAKDKHRGWMAIQERTEKENHPPTIWLARLHKDGPVVPVRMEVASAYGSVVAHLTQSSVK